MKTHRLPVIGATLIAIVPWLLSKPNLLEIFADPLRSIAQVCGLFGMFVIMFAP